MTRRGQQMHTVPEKKKSHVFPDFQYPCLYPTQTVIFSSHEVNTGLGEIPYKYMAAHVYALKPLTQS